MIKYIFILILGFFSLVGKSQYAPAAGQVGSTAIHMDSSVIIAWATQCSLSRGWQNIANQSLGKASNGTNASALNKVDNNVVSLGDEGSAIMLLSMVQDQILSFLKMLLVIIF